MRVTQCWILRVATCHIKLMISIVALHGPALMDFVSWRVQRPPRLACKCTQLLGFWDRLGCDAERVDIAVLAWRHHLLSPVQRKGLCKAVPCPSCPLSPARPPPMTSTNTSLEHLPAPSKWQLRDSLSPSGILSLIPLNGFPMNLSSGFL